MHPLMHLLWLTPDSPVKHFISVPPHHSLIMQDVTYSCATLRLVLSHCQSFVYDMQEFHPSDQSLTRVHPTICQRFCIDYQIGSYEPE